MKVHAFRLKPGDDIKEYIDTYTQDLKIRSGVILSAVGNIKKAVIRLANENIIKTYTDSQWGYEIVSVTGTISTSKNHIHISFSDKKGQTFGGHMKTGCIVRITAEVVIAEFRHMEFKRKFDPQSGFKELVVENLHQD